MSLLGRLEDLSLTDIIQIVFLSRRTGVLEIVNAAGRHTVLFRHGLVVNASAPDHVDLVTFLQKRGVVSAEAAAVIRQTEFHGIPSGVAVVEMNVMTNDDLANAIRDRIVSVVAPLLDSREGDFNFVLSESMSAVDMEYEPDQLFKEGGFAPQKIVGIAEGEKIKPLHGLEESLKAPKPKVPAVQFKVAGGAVEAALAAAAMFRNVILFERDPLVRVAAKRAFGKQKVKFFQSGSLEDIRAAMTELFRLNHYFVSFLELTEDDGSLRVTQQVKRRNPRLPVAVIDREADEGRRRTVLQSGADLYLTRPSPERMHPRKAEEELARFTEELVQFADESFQHWELFTSGGGTESGKRFYDMAEHDSIDRSFDALKLFINELNNPSDINQVAQTILRFSGEYFERGALFIATAEEFVGVGGFGAAGGGETMNDRIRSVRIARGEPSLLEDVAASRAPHAGKIPRTRANVQLIERMGNLLPTEVAALPIMQSGQAIGILYGDNAEHRAPLDSMGGLEIFLSQAGDAFGSAVEAWKTGRGGL